MRLSRGKEPPLSRVTGRQRKQPQESTLIENDSTITCIQVFVAKAEAIKHNLQDFQVTYDIFEVN